MSPKAPSCLARDGRPAETAETRAGQLRLRAVPFENQEGFLVLPIVLNIEPATRATSEGAHALDMSLQVAVNPGASSVSAAASVHRQSEHEVALPGAGHASCGTTQDVEDTAHDAMRASQQALMILDAGVEGLSGGLMALE